MKAIKNLILLSVFVGILLFATGCATMFTSPVKRIDIISNPAQAEIVIKTSKGVEVFKGKTPTYVDLSKKKAYELQISTPGFKPQTLRIARKFQFLTLNNLIWFIFMPVGVGTDYLTGTFWTLKPHSISVNMEKTNLKYGLADEMNTFTVLNIENQRKQVIKAVIPLQQK